MKVAIIGAGAAGCFTALALLKAMPSCEITMFEAREKPYGLVRYGVAPDHLGTKAVTRQFDRLFEREGVILHNSHPIKDVKILSETHNYVVIATGLSKDRKLGIEGENLPHVTQSSIFAAHMNGDEAVQKPKIGEKIAIIGNGNVAIDMARLLLKNYPVQQIYIIGRGTSENAKFDEAMVKELQALPNAALISFEYAQKPLEITAHSLICDKETFEVDTIITAIGYEAGEDALKPTYPNVLTVGWAHYGARGTLPDARVDAKRVVDLMMDMAK
jgi:ferredoxin/flavodoxin---NADP+ reductase